MDKLDIAEALGKQKKAIEKARNFLALGIAPEVVANGSGLSPEEVQELSKEQALKPLNKKAPLVCE